MSILLTTINTKKILYAETSEQFSAIAPNISMGLLHAYLDKQHIPVDFIEADVEQYSIDQLIDSIAKKNPQLVIVIASGANPSASTMTMVGVIKFFKRLKDRGIVHYKTAIYGGHPTVLPERTLRETNADFVIIGEGYETLCGLYSHVNEGRNLETIPGIGYFQNGVFVRNESPPLIDLNDLPMIHWDKFHPSRYRAHNWHCFNDIDHRTPYAILWTNMGCPYPCEFCCINNIFGKRTFRFRPIKQVVAEIDILVNKFGVKNIKILDELFIIKHPRIDEFCDLLEERNYDLNMWCFARTDSVTPEILKRLKKVGLNWVAYGFESNNDRVLKATNKNLKQKDVIKHYAEVIKWTKEADINICADVIVGLWEDDQDSILKLMLFLKQYEFEWINIYPCFAYPGTPLYDRLIKNGIIQEPKVWDGYSLYGYQCKPLPTKYLTSEEVLRLRDEIFWKYYQMPEVIQKLREKFGEKTQKHVEQMISIKLNRKLLEPQNVLSSAIYEENN